MSLFTRYGTNEVVSNESADNPSVDPIRQFYFACESISMEAAEMGAISGWFARMGANVSMSIKRGFELLTTFNWAPLTTLYPANMQTVMRSLDYMEIQSKMVSMPRGFSGNLHDYVMGMQARIALAATIKTAVIDPAIKRLGYYVTNPSERSDRRDFPGGALDANQIAKLYAEEMKYFKGGNDATTNFGSLFSNNQEFVKAEFQMVEYGKVLATCPPETVRASVEQLSAVAQGLFKSLSSERDPASKQLIQTIGNELATTAKWIEWYAIQITKLTEVNQVFATLEKELR
ncbi:virion structural protein [Pseudomonas phage D6]|nr:virion structural protein [Pseudomonas phage D6]